MNKLFFCPYCKKYVDSSYYCPFCSSRSVSYNGWSKLSNEEKEAWMKECPQPNPPIETFKRESAKLRAIDFDAQTRAQLAEGEARKQYVPHCPTCHSPDIEKISGTSKVVDAVVWGVWSRKAGKTFKCRNCGYEW